MTFLITTLSNIGAEFRALITFGLITIVDWLNLFNSALIETPLAKIIISLIISLVFIPFGRDDTAVSPEETETHPSEILPTYSQGFDELILSSEGVIRQQHREES